MDLAAFNQALDDLFAVRVALETHFEGNLFCIEIGILISITRLIFRIDSFKHSAIRAFRVVNICGLCPALF